MLAKYSQMDTQTGWMESVWCRKIIGNIILSGILDKIRTQHKNLKKEIMSVRLTSMLVILKYHKHYPMKRKSLHFRTRQSCIHVQYKMSANGMFSLFHNYTQHLKRNIKLYVRVQTI